MKSPQDVRDMIHDVLPRLPADALELFEHLSVIGENADLAQDLAACLHEVRVSASPTPALSAGFADAVLAALPEGPPAAQDPAVQGPGAAETAAPAAAAGELLPFPAPARPLLWSQLVAAGLLLGCGVLLGVGLRAQPPRMARTSPPPSQAGSQAGSQAPSAIPSARPQPQELVRERPQPEAGRPQPEAGRPQPEAGRPQPEAGRPRPIQAAQTPALLPTPRELQAYVVEASYVLEAIDTSDDPRLARALALHLRRTALVEQGERLLSALRYDPQQRRLRPLIQGTQLVLRKVQHAPRSEAAPLQMIRHEVRRTKLLDACRDLIVASLDPQEPTPRANPQDEGLGPF